MWFKFLTHIKMSKKANIMTAIGVATALTTTPLNAEKLQENQSGKALEEVVCKTKVACEKLSLSIQSQIKEIESKSNLTKNDKKVRYNLKKKLIALEKAETSHNNSVIAEEKQETQTEIKETKLKKEVTKKDNNLIVQEDLKQKKQIETIKTNAKQIKAQLTSIKGSFL